MGERKVIVNMYNVTISRLQQEGRWPDFRGTSQLREWGDFFCVLKPLAWPILILGFQWEGQWLDFRGHSPLCGVSISTNTNSPQEVGRGFKGLSSRMRVGQGKSKPSAQTHVPSGFHVRAEGSRPRSPDHKESIAPSLRLPSPSPLNRDVARSLYPGLPAAAGKTQGRQQAALLTLCPASLSTLAANNPATPAPTTVTLWGFEVRLRPKVRTLSSCS